MSALKNANVHFFLKKNSSYTFKMSAEVLQKYAVYMCLDVHHWSESMVGSHVTIGLLPCAYIYH